MDAENRCQCEMCVRNFKYIGIVERDVRKEDQEFMKDTLGQIMNIEQDNESMKLRLQTYPSTRGFVSEVKKLLAEYANYDGEDKGFVDFLERRLSDGS